MSIIHKCSDTRKQMELTLSEDRLKLFVTVIPGTEHSAATTDEVLHQIKVVAPDHVIDLDVVADITKHLQQGEGCEARRVAKGIPPIDGRDGKLVWLVRRYHAVPDPKEGEARFADFFHLGLFENVRNGQEIARIYKPRNGKAGLDALGKEIPSKSGKPVAFKLDKSVAVKNPNRPDGYDLLVSAVDGYVREDSGTIAVLTVLEIPHNLDYSIGHIDFIGDVVVRGDVHKGFNIRANGDITILGSVQGENILASEKGVFVRGFHQGGEKAAVYAKKGYSVNVAHHVRAEVHGEIEVVKEALDCELRTSTHVAARNGTLQGGTVWCVEGVQAKEIGNVAELTTRVELRNPSEISEEFENLQSNIKKHETALVALELHLGPYAINRGRIANLQGSFRDKIMTLAQKYDRIRASLKTLVAQSAVLAGDKKVNPNAKVNASKVLHAGVSLVARQKVLEVKTEEQGPVSYAPTGEDDAWQKVQYEEFTHKEKDEPKRAR